MPRKIDVSSFECDCGHQINFCENSIRNMERMSRKRRVSVGEGDDRHTVIYDGGRWVAVFCPKAGRDLPAPRGGA